MKKYLLVILLFLPFISYAQSDEDIIDLETPELKLSYYEGYYYAYINGDTVQVIQMKPFTVFSDYKFENKKQKDYYWRTVRDVKKTLPYAKLIYEMLIETFEYIETLPDEESRQAHLNKMEDELFEEYKPVLKKFTFSQGKMLIKLVHRECNQSSYYIIKAFLGDFRATFWQAFGALFGASLKEGWDPEGEDRVINEVCILVEQGML